MSQLNPDAKEFVPVSPTRVNAISPVPNFNRDVVDDTLVARSPRRAMPMDTNVPSPEEFCRGIKQRPSELFEEIEKDVENENNQNQNQNGHQLSHQEIMQNLLNGKDPSEIEFHPSNYNNLIYNESDSNKENEPSETTPVQPDLINADTNAAEAEATATAAAITPTDAADFTTFVPRSQDPMSMSFYQDKNEEGTEFSTNPFDDLNKVQTLPDYIDDLPQSNNQSIDAEIPSPQSPVNIQNDVCELPKSPQLEADADAVADVEVETEAETKSNVDFEAEQDDVCSLPKSPVVQNVCELPQSPPLEICDTPKSPLPNDVCETPKSPLQNDVCEMPKSPLQNEVCEIPKSPIHIDVCEISKSPMLDAHSPMELSSPAGPLSPKSPIPELTGLVSPDITASIKDENVSAEISETTKSPIVSQTPIEELEHQSKSPVATPEIVDDNDMKSPLPTDDVNPVAVAEDNIVTEASNAATDNVVEEEIATAGVDAKVDEIVCEVNQETSDVQELITDAIQDITSEIEINKTNEEQYFENTEESDEPKYLAEHVTNIANEINEITDEENNPDNNINNFININNLEDKQQPIEENSNNLLECTTTTTTTTIDADADAVVSAAEPLNDFIQETEAKSPELNNTSTVESEIAPSDIMNSFLDRSVIPEVTSPLSPPEKFEQERPELWKCEYPLPSQYDIKCETIQPEFPVHTIASPSEESKGNDTPPPTPANVTEEPELKRGSPEPQKIVEAVEKLNEAPAETENKETAPVEAATAVAAAAVVAGAATAAAAAAVGKASAKPKAGSTATAATKKLPNKVSPTSPSKTLASKTTTTAKRTSTTSAPKVTTTTTAKLAPAKPKTTTTPAPSPKPIGRTPPAPKPKTPTTTASKLAADKKPLTNGDAAKAPIRQTLLKKTTTSTVAAKPTTTTTTATSAASKVSLTKTTSATSRPLANGTSKPALSATKTTARPSLSSSAAPKPRPASLTSKSTTATSTTKAAPIKSSTTTATKSPGTTTAKPKPTASAAPRPRMVLTAKTAVKTADTEKQIKETANKQISASRTSTTRTSSTTTRVSTTTLKKPASSLTNRTSTSTRTTTVKSSATGKKPTEVTRTTITKTKSSPIVKPNAEQNGVVNVIQEITTVSVVSENDESHLQLVKDNSPVDAIPPIVDNSQLPPPMEIIAD